MPPKPHVLGAAMSLLLVKLQLKRIFAYRQQAIRELLLY